MKERIEFNNAETDSEQEYRSLSGKEKFERILTLFGTDTARENFIELCKAYIAERRASEHAGARKYSPPKRANLHNRIMDTLTRLATQTRKMDPVTQKVIHEMASREIMALITQEWVSANEYGEEEDEDQRIRKQTAASETAKFHMRGQEDDEDTSRTSNHSGHWWV